MYIVLYIYIIAVIQLSINTFYLKMNHGIFFFLHQQGWFTQYYIWNISLGCLKSSMTESGFSLIRKRVKYLCLLGKDEQKNTLHQPWYSPALIPFDLFSGDQVCLIKCNRLSYFGRFPERIFHAYSRRNFWKMVVRAIIGSPVLSWEHCTMHFL